MPERSPLYELEERAGAVFAEDAGWLMPAHFGDPVAEYHQARTHAALFDVSHHGRLCLAGPDARTFLHNLCTNDVKKLAPGDGCEAYLTTHKARVIAHVRVWYSSAASEHAPEEVWIDAGPGMGERVFKHLDRHLISEQVEITDRTRDTAQPHLAGPEAEMVLRNALQDRADQAPHVFRVQDPLGVPGCDLICKREKATELWQALMAAGARPAGREAYELLRVEAGTPAYGHEIDEDRFAPELGRGDRAISYTKGCYLGQEPIVMARDRGHVNRTLMGLKLSVAPARRGARLLRAGKEVGQVTSSVASPRLGAIALAFVLRGHQEPGTRLEVESADGQQTAEVAALPF